jgi:hypothetical protein
MAKSHAQMMERASAAHDQLAILWIDNPASPGAVGAKVKMGVAQSELPGLGIMAGRGQDGEAKKELPLL